MCVGGPRPGYPPLYPTSPYGFSQPPPGIFPANINSMHVSLSGPNDGLSLTIETSQHGRADTEYSGAPGPSWHCREEANNVKKQKRHHQQSRTIFRCVSSMTLNILHDLYQTIFFLNCFVNSNVDFWVIYWQVRTWRETVTAGPLSHLSYLTTLLWGREREPDMCPILITRWATRER